MTGKKLPHSGTGLGI